jgi:hypothetical protein
MIDVANPSMPKETDREGLIVSDSSAGRYLFRGDDRDRGGSVGRPLGPEADAADIQNFADHVLRKESRLSSRFTSFTTEVKIARKFTSAPEGQFVRKAELARLKALEAQGIIRIWDPDQVFEAMKDRPRKLAKQAADVRAAMRRNREILIEGQIPAGVLTGVNE